MNDLNLLIDNKVKYLDEYLDNIYLNVKNKLEKNFNECLSGMVYKYKQVIKFLKQRKKIYFIAKKNINLQCKISNLIQEIRSKDSIKLKLEDIEAFKIIIEQIEIKERENIKLKQDIDNLNISLSNAKTELNVNTCNYKDLENKFEELQYKNKHSIEIISDLKNDLSIEKNKTLELERNIFELEGVKKMQYEKIFALRDDINKKIQQINSLKDDFKILLQEFNKIMTQIN